MFFLISMFKTGLYFSMHIVWQQGLVFYIFTFFSKISGISRMVFLKKVTGCHYNLHNLSTLVGCWSSVSIRRIIYKFLNVCPFDFTAVAVSGKVERS